MRPINCNRTRLIAVNYHNQLCSSWSWTWHTNISALGVSSFFNVLILCFATGLSMGSDTLWRYNTAKLMLQGTSAFFFLFCLKAPRTWEWSGRDISSALRSRKVPECGAQALNPGLHVGVFPDVNCHSGRHNSTNQSCCCCCCGCCCFRCGGSMAPFLLATWKQSACFST